MNRRSFIGNSLKGVGGSPALLALASSGAVAASSKNSPVEKVFRDSTKVTGYETIKHMASVGHPEAGHKIVGKRVWYKYISGWTAEQYYVDEKHVVWKGIGDEQMESYSQKDEIHVFEIAPEVYFITWNEPTAIDNPIAKIQYPGPWPVWILADFANLLATVAYINPDGPDNSHFILDQAQLEIKEG